MRRLLIGLLLCLGCRGGGGGGDSDASLPDGFGTGGAGGAPPGVSNPSAPVDADAIAQYARELCDSYLRCRPELFPDHTTCVDGISCSIRSLIGGTALTRGELLSCSGSFKNIPCGTTPDVPVACMHLIEAFASTLGDRVGCGGELCEMDSFCDRSNAHCPHCEPYAQVGEACIGTRCARDTHCSSTTLECVPDKTEGMACEQFGECAQPTFGGWLTCRNGLCVKPAMRGQACEQGTDCAGFLNCEAGVCTDRARVGEACGGLQDCQLYSACINGVCTELCGLQRAGGACFDDVFCLDSYCDTATSECVTTKPAGAVCTRSAECSDGYFCTAPGMCTARFADGMACALDEECVSELCNGQVCQEPVCN